MINLLGYLMLNSLDLVALCVLDVGSDDHWPSRSSDWKALAKKESQPNAVWMGSTLLGTSYFVERTTLLNNKQPSALATLIVARYTHEENTCTPLFLNQSLRPYLYLLTSWTSRQTNSSLGNSLVTCLSLHLHWRRVTHFLLFQFKINGIPLNVWLRCTSTT